MNAPCSARKDKFGVGSYIKMFFLSDKMTLITCAVMFFLLCVGPMPFSYLFDGCGVYDILQYTELCSLICVLFAFAVGLMTTNYLSVRESAEFYAKFPVGNRMTLLSKAVKNAIVCIVSIILSLVVLYLLSLVLPSKLTAEENFEAIISLAKLYITFFLLYYTFGILIGTLCGGIYTKIISFLISIFCFGSYVTVKWTFNKDIKKYDDSIKFFLCDVDSKRYDSLVKFFPFADALQKNVKLKNVVNYYSFNEEETMWILAVSAVILALAIFLVKYRRTEYTEYAFNSTIAARVFRALAVLAVYCIVILKMENETFIRIGKEIFYSGEGCVHYPTDVEYTSSFNFVLPLILFGIFLLFSYPLKNRKKALGVYDYLPILLFLIVFEIRMSGYWM